MTLAYGLPLSRAWRRMRVLLFAPAQPNVWLILGVAAFLAGEQYSRFGLGYRFPWREGFPHWHGPGLFIFLAFFAPFLLALALLFAWIFSRGTFVFLDDVLRSRAEIAEPWRRFARQGNSLFLWQLGFGATGLLVFAVTAGPLLWRTWHLDTSDGFPWAFFLPALGLLLPLGLLLAIVSVLTHHFVVPLMWAHDLKVLEAWRRLLPLLGAQPLAFLLYLLFLLVLAVATVVAFILFGFGTLCMGFCAVAIPVIGAAVLLPITIPWRALGPEFLAQFGPEVFPPLPEPHVIDPDAGRPVPVVPPQAPPPWGGPGGSPGQ